MYGFLRKLFSLPPFLDQFWHRGANRLKIVGFWCDTTIRLPQKLKTPCGSRVFVISVCLDVDYWIEDGHLIIRKAKLCQNGDNNIIASNTGEAMRARQISPNALLVEVVQHEWEAKGSTLRRIMLAKWREANSQQQR